VLVVDTSAVIHALVHRPAHPDLLRRLADDDDLGAPHLIDLEVLQALRRMVRIGELTDHQAADLRTDFAAMPLLRFPHTGVADRVWSLRDNLTAYDAAYVALAETMRCPLITSDARMAKASGHLANVEVYPQAN
jgi:predicted nucleic acid-binding protein